jgi:hypothetical protein
MQMWEYLHLDFGGYLPCPDNIFLWPVGVADLEWLRTTFGVRVSVQARKGYVLIDKLFGQAAEVSAALVKRLGLEGWEAVGYCYGEGHYRILFKRPVVATEGGS